MVLDSNVFVSAAIEPSGAPAATLRHWHAQTYDLITSSALLSEIESVLRRPALSRYVRWTADEIQDVLTMLRTLAILVEPEAHLSVIERDPDDNRVLEAAVAGQVDVIVSGDRDLLDLGSYAGIPIRSPREFLAALTPD